MLNRQLRGLPMTLRTFPGSTLAFLLALFTTAVHCDEIDLSGNWRLRLDPDDQGVAQLWFRETLPENIALPGSLPERGFGDEVTMETAWTGGIVDRAWFESPRYEKYRQAGNVQVPFWLQPDKYYAGAAWYQREISVPGNWRDKRITLSLERPHWTTMVWVDQNLAGQQDSLSTPHVYDLTEVLSPGEHVLTVRVDNRLHVGVGINAHSVTDHTQSNWNGLIGGLKLQCSDRVWIDDVQVFTNAARQLATVRATVRNMTKLAAASQLRVGELRCGDHRYSETFPSPNFTLEPDGAKTIEMALPLGESMATWDEFQPDLYRLNLVLEARQGSIQYVDEREVQFGVRDLTTRDSQFLLNGRTLFLRGTLECCIFPLTGYPPTDVASWKRVIQVCQEHGLNHIRFHSWCPPEAAFVAADELGFYFQVECGAWSNQGASIGDGKPIDPWLYAEADRILKAYGNHPSFLLMAYGNEPAGPGRGAKFLRPWVEHYKAKDPRRLYTSAAGWPLIDESQYHNTPAPRIHAWGAGVHDRINSQPPATTADYREFLAKYDVPVVSHEIGQWCVYPNFKEIAKYEGVLKARNFEIFRDFLEQNHLADQAEDFLMASGKLQVLCYKEEIESALRTPGFGGFQLLDLHDFPGQGTALVGILDPFWDSKPYVTPREFRRFCDRSVPLVRLPKRILTNNEHLAANVELYHFGEEDLRDALVVWSLEGEDGATLAAGCFPGRDIARGKLSEVGALDVPLAAVDAPQKLRLVVSVKETPIENDWDVWVYPASDEQDEPDDVLIVNHLHEQAVSALNEGGKVVLMIPPRRVKSDAVIGFSTVFWNTAWTRNQPPHTLGILCDPAHPAFSAFPTEYHTNWQWWELIRHSSAMMLDDMPPDLRPIVQVIDTWFEARRLGLAFEARVGDGKLLVTSMDLQSDLANRAAARQMRQSLLGYVASDRFAPDTSLDLAALQALFRAPSKMEQLGVTATTDSQQPGYPVDHLFDGDSETIWHTSWSDDGTPFPHHVIIDLQATREIQGLSYLPRQDMQNGRVADYAVFLSDDAKAWGDPVTQGTWANTGALQQVTFDSAHRARYLKLVAESEVNGNRWASGAELEINVSE
jgi:hypothetical protein